MDKTYDDMPTELKEWTIKQINDLINGKLSPMKAREMIAIIATSINTPVGNLICDIVTREEKQKDTATKKATWDCRRCDIYTTYPCPVCR